MNDFRFASPTYLYLLLLLPVLYFLVERIRLAARRRLHGFLAPENLGQLLVSRSGLSDRGKKLAFWLALALLVIGLARPQANPRVEEMEGMSLDIYVLLDISRSMDAEDLPPSRLKKAKRTIQHLMEKLSGDRVGVIGFAGSSALFVPLTSDYQIVSTMLQNIDTSVIPTQGTDLDGALELARQAMERGAQSVGASGGPRTNIFLVLSDGEDHGSGKLDAVNRIRKEGGTIFTIAFGTEKGVPIPVRNDHGELLGYKRDRAGNTVVSKVEPKALQEIAKQGGGQFYFSTLEEQEVEDILARVQDSTRSGATMVKARVYEEWFVPFLALALALFLFSFISFRGLITRKQWLVFFLLLPPAHEASANPLRLFWDKEKRAATSSEELAKEGKPEAAAERLKELQAENPDNPGVSFNLGTYLLEAKKLEEGREQLGRLTKKDGALGSESQFNIAGSYALEKKRPEALSAFADLIRKLERKEKVAPGEKELLEAAKKNVARLAEEQNQKSDSQKQEGEDKDQKEKEKKEGKDGKDQNKKDGDKGEEKKKDDGQKDENKKEGDKKEEQNSSSGEGKDEKNQPKLPPRRGGAPFRERDNMGEVDAKRILEALKQQESTLQKKFLKKNGKGSNVSDDANGQDW